MFWLARSLTDTVGEAMLAPAPCIVVDDSLTAAVQRMRAESLSCLLVIDDAQRPVGWLSDAVLREYFLSQVGADWTVAQAMNAPLPTARPYERLIRAVARMQRARAEVLAVVDDAGALRGSLQGSHDVPVSVAGGGFAALLFDDDPDAMAHSKQCQARYARMALDAGMDALHVVTLLGTWNRALYEGAAAFALATMIEHGHGGPPCRYALLVMGSVGRGESMLAPDQDNALVYEDPPRGDGNAVDWWFERFAVHLSSALDRAGLPFCRGGVMASEASWRMSISDWKQRVTGWTRRGESKPLRMCDIFFDAYCVHGDKGLANTLRDGVASAAAHPHFLRALYRVDEAHGVALDLFGRLKGDPRPGPRHGQVQLKLTGLLPLIGAVRIHALGQQIRATGSLERLSALAMDGAVSNDEHEALCDAFAQICNVLLGCQLADIEAGRAPANHVAEQTLGRLQRRRLIEGLHAVRDFRAALQAHLHAQPMFGIAPAGP